MMINKRLIGTVKESKKYIAGNVVSQWVSLAANITMMAAIAKMLESLYEESAIEGKIALTAAVTLVAVIVRFACAIISSRMAYLSSKAVKKTLRELIYKKLLYPICRPYNRQQELPKISPADAPSHAPSRLWAAEQSHQSP